MSGIQESIYREIYDQYKDRVYNTVLSMVRNVEDAEELTQDVFCKAFENLNSFKEEAKISTWLYRIAVNSSIDFIRKKKAMKRFSWLTSLFDQGSGKLVHEPAEFDHPGISLERKEDAKILFEAIETLPEKQQAAFILHNMEGLSYKKMSEVMKTSVSSIESLLFRARQNLRKILERKTDR